MFVWDPGIVFLLIMQLATAVLASAAWTAVWRKPDARRLKWAAGASACCFAVLAAAIAFLFDTAV